MDKIDLIRKYACLLGELPCYVSGAAQIFLKQDGRCYMTAPGADFRNFEYACISDITDRTSVMKDVLLGRREFQALIVTHFPYTEICAAAGRVLVASLDDMAQILGRRVKAVPEERRAIKSALKTGAAALVKGSDPYGVAAGRSLYEAFVAATVLEKSAEVSLKAVVLGGAVPLAGRDCRKMRRQYLKVYSGPEQAFREWEEENTCFPGREEEGGWPPNSPEVRLVEMGKKLLEEDLVKGTWGNLSVRLDEEYMLCTPSGIDYRRVRPQDMVRVRLRDLRAEGRQRPTSEKGLHAGIYMAHPEVQAVIHTHSRYGSIFAAAEVPLQVENEAAVNEVGTSIPVAKYAPPGTKRLTENTLAAIGESPGAIMSHHGMVCCGRSLEEALHRCRQVEQAAEEYISHRFK